MRTSSAIYNRQAMVHVGAAATSSSPLLSGMAILAAVGLGGATFLVTAKPLYGAAAAAAGLLIGAGLHKESAGA